MAIISTPLRSLANIKDRPSSARILNLLERTDYITRNTEGAFEPFFRNRSLNSAIFLKHRFRPNEIEIFHDTRTVGTKIFDVFNTKRLEEGGKYVFVDEQGVEDIYHENFGMGPQADPEEVASDIKLLRILDRLPSLDPFLLRERLRLDGYHPHEAYFDLNPAEYKQIRNFVEHEFTPLAEMAYAQESRVSGQIEKLVDKMWDSRDIKAIRPLINSLQINPDEAPEVLFAWKGFIYYKSHLGIVKQAFEGFQNRVRHLNIVHFPSKSIELQIEDMRETTLTGLKRELVDIQKKIAGYDQAYKTSLLRRRDPKGFRVFLDEAPSMFYDLGASIAGIKHAMSFWEYRFSGKLSKICDAEEFLDIMRDFRQGVKPELLEKEPA
jgi:hypothetical protein